MTPLLKSMAQAILDENIEDMPELLDLAYETYGRRKKTHCVVTLYNIETDQIHLCNMPTDIDIVDIEKFFFCFNYQTILVSYSFFQKQNDFYDIQTITEIVSPSKLFVHRQCVISKEIAKEYLRCIENHAYADELKQFLRDLING